jgi:hypothetical protein
MTTGRVAILGCGPAGLLAAHATRLTGNSFVIYSHMRKSPMLGAQFMHRAIPGLDLQAPQKLVYMLHGQYDGYRQKVYGDQDVEFVSPETFSGFHEAWSIRQAYELLWNMYSNFIVEATIDHTYVARLLQTHDMVISTIPAQLLCYNNHQFIGQQVWVDDTWHGPDTAALFEYYGTTNLVICDGTSVNAWYRTSYIFGHSNTEWPKTKKAPFASHNAVKVTKPITNNCNCWPNVVRAGRYGSWMKGILSHEAFEVAVEVLS